MSRKLFRCSYLFGVFVFLQFAAYNVFSQQETKASIVNKFELYSRKALQEKIFLHTDKELYVAGEILWFKIYYVDGASGKPLHLSKVAYVEILNGTGKAELQAKISLDSGHSDGSFYLPVTLNSGTYIIRSYTNWMKNFDAGYFFEKKITIVNTIKNPEQMAHTDSGGITIDFFPEGGNLVRDVQNRMGFRATDSNALGLDFFGFIVNEAGDTVTRFRPFKFGIGSFLFKPILNHLYKAVILLLNGTTINKPLPEVYNYGYVINVHDKGEGFLSIIVYRKKLPGARDADQLILAAHTRQVLDIVETKIIDNSDSTIFLIDKKKIGQGITHFTLFSGTGKPLCERLFFIKPASTISLKVTGDKDLYGTRSEVNLSIHAHYDRGPESALNLSASVFYMDTLQQNEPADIIDYMWLTSDIIGDVESPAFYFTDSPEADIAVDNLMLTQGWRRFKWDDILNDRSFIKFLPEYNGHLISGIIKNTYQGKVVGGSNAFLSIPGRPFGFYVSKSDTNGLVKFEVKNYYGNGSIIARPGIQTDSFYKVQILSPYSESKTRKKYFPYEPTPGMKEQLLKRSINMQVQNIYSGEELKKFITPIVADTLPFFGYPEVTYNLDDYKRFTTMEEVLREYVREINVGVRNGKLTFKMFSPALHDFYDDNVLVLIDGVPLGDPDKIFSFDPLKVKKLDIIQSQYVLGPAIFNGIASFSTYEGLFDRFEIDPRLVAIDYDGLQLRREFYSPLYKTQAQLEKRIPDFRTTLLWSPDIISEEGETRIQFCTSDRPGRYMVILQGMSTDGDLVSARTFFDVK